MSLVDPFSRDKDVQREILPDGTLHKKIVLTREDSDSKKKETLETFEKPPKLEEDMEIIEEILPDGTKIIRRVSLSRVVHSIKTRHESFDESSGRQVEDYEMEEVIPNTSSAFDAGVDSDYEEELQRKKARSLSLEQNMEEIDEVLPDGTRVKRKVTLSRVVHTTKGEDDAVDPRKGQGYPAAEVVPGTSSAFITGQDSECD